MRHSAAHVMAEAVVGLFPDAQLGIGPAIDDGFYYDFLLPRPLTPDDLAAIEAGMRASVEADHPFVRKEVPGPRAEPSSKTATSPSRWRSWTTWPLGRATRAQPVPPTSTYEHGPFIDLCKGPHVASTGKIGPFKLMTVAGAYWRGSEKRPMLQRIYGTVWPTQDELDDYLHRREEAKRRDHRRLGVQLDLYSFHDVSPGSAFWHPKGQRSVADPRDRHSRGPGAARLPGNRALRCSSTRSCGSSPATGPTTRTTCSSLESEGQTFSLKPMNCPESTFIYKSKLRSYRDLPLRFSDFGRLHRNERSGTLSGLTRVRHFVQDDAHIYLRPDQLQDEIAALLGEVYEVYGWFGLEPRFTFGTRPEKALGDPALWETGRSRRSRRPSTRWASPIASSQATGPSTRPRSTSRSTTPWDASGRRPRSRWTW